MKSTRRVLGHSLLCSRICSHRSFVRSRAPLRTLVRSLARSLTHSLRSSWERGFCLCIARVDFIQFQPIVRRSLEQGRRIARMHQSWTRFHPNNRISVLFNRIHLVVFQPSVTATIYDVLFSSLSRIQFASRDILRFFR